MIPKKLLTRWSFENTRPTDRLMLMWEALKITQTNLSSKGNLDTRKSCQAVANGVCLLMVSKNAGFATTMCTQWPFGQRIMAGKKWIKSSRLKKRMWLIKLRRLIITSKITPGISLSSLQLRTNGSQQSFQQSNTSSTILIQKPLITYNN